MVDEPVSARQSEGDFQTDYDFVVPVIRCSIRH